MSLAGEVQGFHRRSFAGSGQRHAVRRGPGQWDYQWDYQWDRPFRPPPRRASPATAPSPPTTATTVMGTSFSIPRTPLKRSSWGEQQFLLCGGEGRGAGPGQVLQSAVFLWRRGFGQNPLAPRHWPAVGGNKGRARGICFSEKFTNEYIDAIQNNQLPISAENTGRRTCY